MLAAVTTCGVTLLDLTSSRPSASASTIPIPFSNSSAHCATWSTDGVYLHVAWSHGVVYKYEKSGKSCGMVWKAEEASGPLVALAARDKDTIIVAYGGKVVAVDLIKKHPTVELLKSSEPLVSLVLSNDASILAACSRNTVHLCDLATSTVSVIDANIVLSSIYACDPSSKDKDLAFTKLVSHPHRRDRCFLACGSYLVVLSARKPQSPLKVVKVIDEMVCIAASPTSKGLVVAATLSKQLCIVDVEADQSVVRTIECGIPLTTVVVSTDGLSALAGGEDGKILRVDLRASERLPRTIFSVMKKQSILALSIPVKTIRSQLNLVLNSSTILNTTRSTIETNPSMKAQPLRDHNGLAGAAPARVPSTSPNMLGKNMKAKRIAGTLSPKVSRVSRQGSPTKPTRPASIFIQSPTRATANVASPTASTATRSPIFTRASRDATAGGLTGRSRLRNVASSSALAREVTTVRPASRARSGMGKVPISPFSRPRSSASITTPTFRPFSKQVDAKPRSQVSLATTERTPSPDLPAVGDVSAIFARVQNDGYGTPSTVTDDESDPPSPSPAISRKPIVGSPEFIKLEAEFRPASVVSTSSSTFMRGLHEDGPDEKKVKWSCDTESHYAHDEDEKTARLHGKAANMTPPRSQTEEPSVVVMKSPAAGVALGEAQDFLRNTLQEVMYEEHAQQREELRALHLDMVRMGRDWKNELRALMDEYVGDFKALQKENERLRQENERLRRGY